MDDLNQNNPEFLAALLSAVRDGEVVVVEDFARLTGTGEREIAKAYADGRLPTAPGGRIPMREGVIALVSAGGLRRGQVPQFLTEADTVARAILGLPIRDQSSNIDIDGRTAKLKLLLLNARAEASKALAEKTKLETDIKKGVYVLRAEVELDAATTATQVSTALMQLPARLSGMCAGLPAEDIARIVRDEVSHIVRVIQTAAFTGDWGDE